MRTLILIAAATVITAPASAQDWNAEQMEVWEFELECSAMSPADRVAQCFHEAYVGWNAADPLPVDLDAMRASNPYWSNATLITARPLAIIVIGDVAVVHLMLQNAVPLADGGATLVWSRWTDVLLNDGGRWGWIADAGGNLKSYRGDGSEEED